MNTFFKPSEEAPIARKFKASELDKQATIAELTALYNFTFATRIVEVWSTFPEELDQACTFDTPFTVDRFHGKEIIQKETQKSIDWFWYGEKELGLPCWVWACESSVMLFAAFMYIFGG